MRIPEEKKIEILMAQLQERYDALHKMRDRSLRFTLWILGFGLGLAWLLVCEDGFALSEKIGLSITLLLLLLLSLYFIWSIGKGFNKTRQVAIKLERILKLYDENCYFGENPILPPKYNSPKTGIAGHFKTLNIFILIVWCILMLLTWSNTCKKTCINKTELPNIGSHS